MKKIVIFILVLTFFSGCGESLRSLMRISREQDAIQKQMKLQDRRFEILLRDVERGRLKPGQITKNQIISKYGEPILSKVTYGVEKLLYRDAADFFPTQKVYLFFNENGILVDSQIEEKE